MNSELLQLLAGTAGAFLGGGLLVWRASRRLPHLINGIVTVVTSAIKDVIMDDVRQAIRDELGERDARQDTVLEHLEGRIISLEERRRSGR